MTHPDRWRRDQILAGEEKRMALAEASLDALVTPDREPTSVSDLLPKPKRRWSARPIRAVRRRPTRRGRHVRALPGHQRTLPEGCLGRPRSAEPPRRPTRGSTRSDRG